VGVKGRLKQRLKSKEGKKERKKYTINNPSVPVRFCKYSGYMMEVTEWAPSNL
jgi:hypothetical protein